MTHPSVEQLIEELERELDPSEQVRVIHRICWKIHRVEPKLAQRYARKGMKIARALGDRLAMAITHRIQGSCWHNLCEYDAAVRCYEASIRLLSSIGNEEEKAGPLHNLGLISYLRYDLGGAMRYFQQARELYHRFDKRGEGAVLNNISSIRLSLGDYVGAIEGYTEAARLSREAGKFGDEKVALSEIGMVYFSMGNYHKSIEYYRIALDGHPGETAMTATAYLNIAQSYLKLGELDHAYANASESLRISREVDHPRMQAQVLAVIGEIHTKADNMSEALAAVEQSLAISAMLKDNAGFVDVATSIGIIYMQAGMLDEAERFLCDMLLKTQEEGLVQCEAEIHEVLADVLEKKGESGRALRHFREYHRIEKETLDERQRILISEITARFGVERSERDREIEMLKNQRLQQEIGFKEKEISAMALNLRERNRLLARLGSMIAEGARGADGADTLVESLLREIENESRRATTPGKFAEEVENVKSELNRKLLERFPALSAAELRVCALLRGNMSTKEIADLLNVTTRNVEAHRYHIRQKMRLPKNINLTTFLLSL